MPSAAATVLIVGLVNLAIGLLIGYSITNRGISRSAGIHAVRVSAGALIAALALMAALLFTRPYALDRQAWALWCALTELLALIGLAHWWYRSLPLGAAIVDLGWSPWQALGGLLLLLAGVAPLVFLLRLQPGEEYGRAAAFILMCGSFAAAFTLGNLGRRQVREGGIVDFSGPILWRQVRRHEWGGETGYTLTLWTTRNPFFGWGAVHIDIPPEHAGTVERLLRAYAPRESVILPRPS
jgi:hypothetical protein